MPGASKTNKVGEEGKKEEYQLLNLASDTEDVEGPGDTGKEDSTKSLTWFEYLKRVFKYVVMTAFFGTMDVMSDGLTGYIYHVNGYEAFACLSAVLLIVTPTATWLFLWMSNADPDPFWKHVTTITLWEGAWKAVGEGKQNFGLAFVALGETCLEAFPGSLVQQFSMMADMTKKDGKLFNIIPQEYVLFSSMGLSLLIMTKTLVQFDYYGQDPSIASQVIRAICRLGEVGTRVLSLSQFWFLLRPEAASSHGISSFHMPILLGASYSINLLLMMGLKNKVAFGQRLLWSTFLMLGSSPKFLTAFEVIQCRFFMYRALELLVMVALAMRFGHPLSDYAKSQPFFPLAFMSSVTLLVFGHLISVCYERNDRHKGSKASSALFEAIENNDIFMVKLLAQLSDLSMPNRDGNTAVHVAASNGQQEVVKILKELGADMNAKDNDGETAVHKAARKGFSDVVKILGEAGADVNIKDKYGDTPMHYAARKGKPEVIKILKELGADINAKDNVGDTAAHDAASYGHAEVVKILKELGADLNAKNQSGETAAHRAASFEVLKILKELGADMNVENNAGDTAAAIAASYGWEV